jgi:hypothetical protein
MAEYDVVERDEAGNVTAMYAASGGGRVDVIVRIYVFYFIWRTQCV